MSQLTTSINLLENKLQFYIRLKLEKTHPCDKRQIARRNINKIFLFTIIFHTDNTLNCVSSVSNTISISCKNATTIVFSVSMISSLYFKELSSTMTDGNNNNNNNNNEKIIKINDIIIIIIMTALSQSLNSYATKHVIKLAKLGSSLSPIFY